MCFFFQASPSYQAEKVSGAILKQEFHENESMSSREPGDFFVYNFTDTDIYYKQINPC